MLKINKFSVDLLDLRLKTLCLASSAHQQEIFGGTNFREQAFDREHRENFPLYSITTSIHTGELYMAVLELAIKVTNQVLYYTTESTADIPICLV